MIKHYYFIRVGGHWIHLYQLENSQNNTFFNKTYFNLEETKETKGIMDDDKKQIKKQRKPYE